MPQTIKNRVDTNSFQSELQQQIEFEKIIGAISARFISLNSSDIDYGVAHALEAIGRFVQADRASVFALAEDQPALLNTHEWRTGSAPACREAWPQLPLTALPWSLAQLQRIEVVNIPDIVQLPATDLVFFRQRQTQAALLVPMLYNDALVGFLALETTCAPQQWPINFVPLLKIVGEMFVSAFDRNKTETALRQSEERFRRVVSSVSDHIYFTEVTGNAQHLNLYLSPNIEELTGYPLERFLNDWSFWPTRVIHPDDQPAAAQQAARLASGQNGQMEYRLVKANGDVIWVRDSGRTEMAGNSRLVYGVVADITERKQVEAALAAERALLAQRVEERTAELSLANAELARAARLKDEFLASMSHELRTPLNAVLGMSEALQEQVYGPLNDKQFNALQRIEESGRHLLSLINDILDLSRIEAGKLELQVTMVDIYAVCQASLYFIDKAAHDKNLTVLAQIGDDINLYADERRLKQVLVNLLSNAVKFTPNGGQIGLEVINVPEEPAVKFIVWDTGIGIAQEDMGRLFKPFVQLDSRLSRHYEGTGLGLTLVYRMVEMHQGSVTVESEVGQGSRFIVTLPAYARPDAQEQDAPRPEEITKPAGSASPATLILLAEDNEANIATISDYLEAKGYNLVIARDGAEALLRSKEIHPDLALIDIQMPIMDGLETIHRLRADVQFNTMPIIALTALAMPGDRERCLNAGANEYISKPVSLRRLANVIEQLL